MLLNQLFLRFQSRFPSSRLLLRLLRLCKLQSEENRELNMFPIRDQLSSMKNKNMFNMSQEKER